MRKITYILVISAILSLCSCSNRNDNYRFQETDVTTENKDADALYENEEYEKSLDLYLTAMQENSKDINARIGAIKCQIALENYNMALMNLQLAVQVSPQTEELYDLYLEISEVTEDISAARTAVNYAKRYNVQDFLEKVPQKPILEYESGKYDRRVSVSVEVAEDDSQIYISVSKVDGYDYRNIAYTSPWIMTSGETKLTAYSVKNGIPSETVEATYICEYLPTTVCFEDPVMEQLVRNTLDKKEGEITDIDCEQITSLQSYKLQTEGMDYDEYQALKIHSLSDLKFFPNLITLDLYKQPEIKDFSCITSCPMLNQLDIQECGISDISFLLDMPMVMYLYVSNNKLSNVDPLLQNKQLRYLAINGNPIKDVSKLTSLENLYYLDFDADQTQNMEFLLQFKNLKDLSISRHDNADLSIIGELNQLERLTIAYDYQENEYYHDRIPITDISYLKNLKNLEYLSIDCLNDLSQVENLEGLNNLRDLYLYNRSSNDSQKDERIIEDLQLALPQCNIHYY